MACNLAVPLGKPHASSGRRQEWQSALESGARRVHGSGVMRDHRMIDERSLAFDRLIAAKLRADPSLIDKARRNLSRWMQTADASTHPILRQWQMLLDGPMALLLSTLESPEEHAAQLRQSSPFCGILSREERTRIIQEFHNRESRAA
jgi:hypothetical protein